MHPKAKALFQTISSQLLVGNYQQFPIWFDLVNSYSNSPEGQSNLLKAINELQLPQTDPDAKLESSHKDKALALYFTFFQNLKDWLILKKRQKAIAYFDGLIEQANQALAEKKALLPTYAFAMNCRAIIYELNPQRPTDYHTAIALYDQAIALGNSNALNNRAVLSYQLEGKKHPSVVIALFERAIKLGDSHAMGNRATFYHLGIGGVRNHTAAINLFNRAIALGNSRAMTNCAAIHQSEHEGRQADYPAAIELLEQAIVLNNTNAMIKRAVMHQFGQGGPIDYPAAIALYDQAIALGDSHAMCHRAHMYQFGQGGPANDPAAIALYDRAIRNGLNLEKKNMTAQKLTQLLSKTENQTPQAASAILEERWTSFLKDNPFSKPLFHYFSQHLPSLVDKLLTITNLKVLKRVTHPDHQIVKLLEKETTLFFFSSRRYLSAVQRHVREIEKPRLTFLSGLGIRNDNTGPATSKAAINGKAIDEKGQKIPLAQFRENELYDPNVLPIIFDYAYSEAQPPSEEEQQSDEKPLHP